MRASSWEFPSSRRGKTAGTSPWEDHPCYTQCTYSNPVVLSLCSTRTHVSSTFPQTQSGLFETTAHQLFLYFFFLPLRKEYASANEQERCYYRDKYEFVLTYYFKKANRSQTSVPNDHCNSGCETPLTTDGGNPGLLTPPRVENHCVRHHFLPEMLPWIYKIIAA